MNNSKKIGLSIFFISILSEIFRRYRGNNASFYEDINAGALNNINYLNDIYVNYDQIVSTSPIYYFISLFPVNLNNDILGFILFTIFAFIGIYSLIKIIDHIVDLDLVSKFLVLIALVFIDYAFLEMVQTSPISTSLKPTLVTQSLMFAAIYLSISKRIIFGNFLIGIMILSNAKMAWLILMIYSLWLLFILIKERLNLLQAITYIFPFLCALYILNGVSIDSESQYDLLNIISNRNGSEDLFLYHDKYSLIGYITLIFTGHLLILKYKNTTNAFISIAFIVSSVASLAGIFYQFFLIDIYPSSSIVLMSFVRNANLVFITWMLLILSIFSQLYNKNLASILILMTAIIFSRFELIAIFIIIIITVAALTKNKIDKIIFIKELQKINIEKPIFILSTGLFFIV